MSSITDNSGKRGKSTSTTRPSVNLKMPRETLSVQLLETNENPPATSRESNAQPQQSSRSHVIKVPLKKTKSSSLLNHKKSLKIKIAHGDH